MSVDVSLQVWHKGVDLVASTAYLTLTEKMGFGRRLLGLKRLDHYGFSLPAADAPATVAAVKRLAAVQSLFYNRNKHNYLMVCTWDGHEDRDGTDLQDVERRLVADIGRHAKVDDSQEIRRKQSSHRVILKNVPVYRTEILVEDLESSARDALARKLETELGLTAVTVSALGTCWHLALQVGSEEEASTVTGDIVVSQRRDRGLLLNPNDQGFRILSLHKMDFGQK